MTHLIIVKWKNKPRTTAAAKIDMRNMASVGCTQCKRERERGRNEIQKKTRDRKTARGRAEMNLYLI